MTSTATATSRNGGYTYDERSILGNRTERVVRRNFRISVEAEDNARGDAASAASCVVTLACKRAKAGRKEKIEATITGYRILKIVYGDPLTGHFERYFVPANLSRQLHEFDDPDHPRTAINPQEYTFKPVDDRWRDRRQYAFSAKTGTGERQLRALSDAVGGAVAGSAEQDELGEARPDRRDGRAASEVLGHDCRKRQIFRAL